MSLNPTDESLRHCALQSRVGVAVAVRGIPFAAFLINLPAEPWRNSNA
jgi:hypothetical protein